MAEASRLLIVEDTPSLARTYAAHLKPDFREIEIADTGEKAIASARHSVPDCILLDLRLPDMEGMALLERWIGEAVAAPVVVITANGSMAVAVDAMRCGASDFVVKPTTRDRLRTIVKGAMEAFSARPTAIGPMAAPIAQPVDPSGTFGIIGQSLVMQGVFKSIEAAAPSRASVFVTGETGTGKELVARAVHRLSPRSGARFVALNCGAIPKDLIESEIFGHVKGAFTGATADRTGAAELAEGGTLFLDELGEMPIELQPKLLRFLQLGEYSRVGEATVRTANIRIVAATNRNPLDAVRAGRLREDLYYRLHVVPIALPPLRERGADILRLAEHFLVRFQAEEGKSFDGFARDAEAWLISHAWPGNVRELENLVRQIVVLHPGGTIEKVDLPISVAEGSLTTVLDVHSAMAGTRTAVAHAQFGDGQLSMSGGLVQSDLAPWLAEPAYELEPLWVTEKKAIERAIALCRGNIVAAAKQLQINPSTIYRKKAAWARTTSA